MRVSVRCIHLSRIECQQVPPLIEVLADMEVLVERVFHKRMHACLLNQ
jgi:hypothetical protein